MALDGGQRRTTDLFWLLLPGLMCLESRLACKGLLVNYKELFMACCDYLNTRQDSSIAVAMEAFTAEEPWILADPRLQA